MKIALLSCLNELSLGYILKEILKEDLTVDAVLLDSKNLPEADVELYRERTQGKLPPIPLSKFENDCIPFYFVENHNSENCANLVKSLGIDILVNAGTPRILRSTILSAPSVGVISCHPGLLPKFRGCSCVEWAIYLDEEVGCTVYLMDDKIDEGPAIIKEAIHFCREDTYIDVRIKVYHHEFELLARGVSEIVRGNIDIDSLKPQKGGGYYSVIDNEKMTEVLDKLSHGKYKYQSEPKLSPDN